MAELWRLVVKFGPQLLDALRLTTLVFAISALCSVFLGVLIAVLMSFRRALWLRPALVLYIELFRHPPLLTHLFFFFYGLPFLGIWIPAFWAGVLAITLNEGAFIAEIVRGFIAAIPKDDWDAARSMGLNELQILRYVVVPQALRDAIPAITGQISIVLKDTSLLGLIGIAELTNQANRIYMTTFNYNILFVSAGIYIIVYTLFNFLSHFIEEKIRVKRV